MSTGKIKFFNESKGFGFVKDNETDQEFFVHVSGLKQPVKQNDEVEYEVSEGKKGLMAINVKVIK